MKIKSLIQLTSAAALLPFAASAATIVWDGLGDATTYEDGLNWGGTAPTDDLTTDIAQFTGGTVDLSTTRQVSGLDYNSSSTLSGSGSIEIGTGGINVSANSALNTAGLVLNQPNTTITFAGGRLSWGNDVVASGTGALTVTGNNTLFIDRAGANTYQGGTTIEGGASIGMKNGDSLGSGSLTLDNGTLFTNGANWAFDETITVNAGGGTINANNNEITLNGTAVISGTGAMTFEANTYGDGIKINNAANTYTGGTTIDNTKVWLKGGNNLSTGDITLVNGGTIKNWNSSYTLANNIIVDATGGAIESGWSNRRITLSGVISGAGELTITNDTSEVYISGTNNTYAGGTKILGNLAAENAGSLGTGAITFDGGFLRNDNSNIDLGTRDIIIEDGGAEINVGWSNKRIQMNGVVSGTGAITVMDDSSSLILSNTNTYSGGTEIQGFAQASTGSLGTGDVTLNNIHGSRGQLKNNGGATTLTNNLIISANGGQMMAGWTSNLEVSGVVSGSGDLVVVGDSGTVVLSNTGNTFTGNINLQDSNSALSVASLGGGAYAGVISGDAAATFTWTGDGTFTGTNTLANGATVASGGSIGGSGSFVNLTLESGSTFIFSETDTLTVTDTVSLFAGFGVDDIEGLSSATAVGTYMLIDNGGDFSGLDNFGLANAYDLGGGISAYFQNGSLELVVVPEPGTFALLAGMLALGSVMIRRRRS